jgi:hypothetical protein
MPAVKWAFFPILPKNESLKIILKDEPGEGLLSQHCKKIEYMKNMIVRNGVFAGIALGTFLILSMLLFPMKTYGAGTGMLIGYSGMLLGFLFIFIGVKNARTEAQDKWNFGKAFLTGLGIMAIASVFYAVAWLIYFYAFDPNWMTDYVAQAVERLQSSGLPPEDIAKKTAEMQKMQGYYENPLLVFSFTYLEPLPPGILMSLVAAFIWGKKP